ncbi:hypothetical protein F9C07_2283821, partial [Aspergillus flavus]
MSSSEIENALTAFSDACEAVEKAHTGQAQDILFGEKFINSLSKLWKRLPKEAKNKINIPRDANVSKQKYRPSKKPSMIVLTKSREEDILHWSKDYKSFFDDKNGHQIIDFTSDPIPKLYNVLYLSTTRPDRDMLRGRLLRVLLYQLKARLCCKRLNSDNLERITGIIHESGLTQHDLKMISADIKSWTRAGKKYDGLCRDLADKEDLQSYRYLGTLFCLPDTVTDRSLRDIPDEGEKRRPKIKNFVSRGIRNLVHKDTMNELANNIFQHLWTQIELFISQIGGGDSLLSLNDWRLKHLQMLRVQNSGSAVAENPAISTRDTFTRDSAHPQSSPTVAPVSQSNAVPDVDSSPGVPQNRSNQPGYRAAGVNQPPATTQYTSNQSTFVQPPMPPTSDTLPQEQQGGYFYDPSIFGQPPIPPSSDTLPQEQQGGYFYDPSIFGQPPI